MDQELKTTGLNNCSMENTTTNAETVVDTCDNDDDDPVNIDVKVLSNLLQSLDMEGGGTGPVSNMMREMGLNVDK